jgi:hypothetical protein
MINSTPGAVQDLSTNDTVIQYAVCGGSASILLAILSFEPDGEEDPGAEHVWFGIIITDLLCPTTLACPDSLPVDTQLPPATLLSGAQ